MTGPRGSGTKFLKSVNFAMDKRHKEIAVMQKAEISYLKHTYIDFACCLIFSGVILSLEHVLFSYVHTYS